MGPALSTTLTNWTVEVGWVSGSDGFSGGFRDNHGCQNVTNALLESLSDPSRLPCMYWLRQDCHLLFITEEISRARRDFPMECLIWDSTPGQGLTPAGGTLSAPHPSPAAVLQMRMPERSSRESALSDDAGLLGVRLTLSSRGPCRD